MFVSINLLPLQVASDDVPEWDCTVSSKLSVFAMSDNAILIRLVLSSCRLT